MADDVLHRPADPVGGDGGGIRNRGGLIAQFGSESLRRLQGSFHLFRHAASYFGNAEAQYRLARLYMNGDGVEKNLGLAVNWLSIAAKKQHAVTATTTISTEPAKVEITPKKEKFT